jgi:phosphoribosylpyrophosphate synthetase
MRVAIVGSRKFPQLKMIEWFIRDLPNGVIIVSGGAVGVDKAAVAYASARGLETKEFLPDLTGCKKRLDYTRAYYSRNQQIVEDADLVVAFTEKDYGGTWDTIRRARKAQKPVKIIKPAAFFPGESSQDDKMQTSGSRPANKPAEKIEKTRGPFAVKGVSLGSYALRLKRDIMSEEWADILDGKDNRPDKLAETMVPFFLDYFAKNKRFGFIHAVTSPPRSIRNLEKIHVMDLVCEQVASELGCDRVVMFHPWEKSTRGRHAKHGKITITNEVARYTGKIVWVLDDICTTRYTLKSSVQALLSLEVHAHGLAYVLMA